MGNGTARPTRLNWSAPSIIQPPAMFVRVTPTGKRRYKTEHAGANITRNRSPMVIFMSLNFLHVSEHYDDFCINFGFIGEEK